MKKLPQAFIFILYLLNRSKNYESVIGDFEEYYNVLYQQSGTFKANTQCLLLIFRSIPKFVKSTTYWSAAMLINYLKIALRNIKRSKVYSFINVFGLAVGIASCLLILLFINDELSYDKYHANADRTYRIWMERTYPDKVRDWGWTAPMLSSTVKNDYPEVEKATRIYDNRTAMQVTLHDKMMTSDDIILGDPNFFEVFSIKITTGDPLTALSKPNSVVLTETTAKKIFGSEDPIGNILQIGNFENNSFIVTAISEDVPAMTHFNYDFLLSFNSIDLHNDTDWTSRWRVWTYVVLNENVDQMEFEQKLQSVITSYIAPPISEMFNMTFEDFLASGNGYRLVTQPITDIHLTSNLEQELETNGNIQYVYIFSLIAIFILIIACINFMNLSTARSSARSKEVGIRKTLGSLRKQLISQFLSESIILSLFSMMTALIIAELMLPGFNSLTSKELSFPYFSNPYVIPSLLGFSVFVGILSGSYPAFFLSAFKPVSVLNGGTGKNAKGRFLINGLVIFQFATSIALIVSTLVIQNQIDFMINKDLGFDKEQVIVVENINELENKVEAFKNELKQFSSIVNAAGSYNLPGEAFDGVTFRPVGETVDKSVSISDIYADYDYIATLGFDIAAGRDFLVERVDTARIVINEAAARALGLDDPIGIKLTDSGYEPEIIGVVKDFHFKSLHSDITPVKFTVVRGGGANYLSVRIKSDNFKQTIGKIKWAWTEFTGNQSFKYFFLDESVARYYEAEEKTGQISRMFSVLAILIGCLGLFGLATYTAEQRTKEIGVRKVLGASVATIVFLLTKDFVKLVGFAFLISTPISYYLMKQWLDDFAYRTVIDLEVFAIAGGLTLVIAVVTISLRIIKAASQNPAKTLSTE